VTSQKKTLCGRHEIKKHVAKSVREKSSPKKDAPQFTPSLDGYAGIQEVKPVREVMVKRKLRRFDPEAVARLKEKLGIAKESA
jgi:hypothetical protein